MVENDKNMLNKVKKFFEKIFQKSPLTIFTKELNADFAFFTYIITEKRVVYYKEKSAF